MQVILLRDVAGVGQKGSVKSVSDGYALNHLIPNKLAQLATAEALTTLEKKRAADTAHREAQEKEWSAIVEKMKHFKLLLKAHASEQGHLYKKISPDEIAKLLMEQGVDVPVDAIEPKMPIKQTGSWPVAIRLGQKEATITIEVIAT